MLHLNTVNSVLRIASIIGFFLSVYAYFVEITKEHDAKYLAMCDISEHMSCSKVFTSKYGRGFGLLYHIVGEDSVLNQPNSVGGMFFYTSLIALSYSNNVLAAKTLVGLCILSNLGSIYLACILYFVLHDFCVVCISTYVVNAINLALTISRLRQISNGSLKNKSE